MPELRIVLNRKHPDYEKIVSGIRANLTQLDSITVTEVSQTQEAGTLTAEWAQVTEFVIQHAGDLADIAKALVEMATAVILLRSAKKQAKDTEKPVVMKSEDGELALPASVEKKKAFAATVRGASASSPLVERKHGSGSARTRRRSRPTKKAR